MPANATVNQVLTSAAPTATTGALAVITGEFLRVRFEGARPRTVEVDVRTTANGFTSSEVTVGPDGYATGVLMGGDSVEVVFTFKPSIEEQQEQQINAIVEIGS